MSESHWQRAAWRRSGRVARGWVGTPALILMSSSMVASSSRSIKPRDSECHRLRLDISGSIVFQLSNLFVLCVPD